MSEQDIDAQLEGQRKRGSKTSSAYASNYDPRVSNGIRWVWTTIGGLVVLIWIGAYNKLSDINDTLIKAVSKLEAQGGQITELRSEVTKQRDEIASLRAQVYMLEGKTLRGIQEATRGH